MKFTQCFLVTRERNDRKRIELKWIEYVFNEPLYEAVQADGRIKRWANIKETGKYLRIVILADEETIHNAFFDRNFKILSYENHLFRRYRHAFGLL
mgnify:CR=1 FL=1